ncbi:PPOX class F420-dependent oxidoreductase [Nocardia suismassiliense]|uniref:PPOX class F420-dependent oxidoreductase n=1 Tax=Nocardia suismassiliense TaxID=2077092 RepID=A0ABW6QW15_9NOCA
MSRLFGAPLLSTAWEITLSDATIALLDGKNYAALATLNADGSPQTSAMWVLRDGDDLLFSTLEGRLEHRNMLRDPRVSVTVIDFADGKHYVELRGRATITHDDDLRVGHRLSWKYDGKDYDEPAPGQVRVEVDKATGYAA